MQVEEYDIHAVTGGAEAMGEVSVHLSEDTHHATGRGVSTDVVEASAKAYIDGLNRLAIRAGWENQRSGEV